MRFHASSRKHDQVGNGINRIQSSNCFCKRRYMLICFPNAPLDDVFPVAPIKLPKDAVVFSSLDVLCEGDRLKSLVNVRSDRNHFIPKPSLSTTAYQNFRIKDKRDL
jgi:hypothetical protein